ncbi:MAG: Gfo/Idh/MocA family oxidoreductase [Myxococcota bacterium]
MAATIRYGIIGTGMMGIEHMLNVRIIPDAVVTAIADTNETSRGWARDTAPEIEVYSDYREMIERAPIDAVVVATPNFTHAEVLAHLLQTDHHILVEKPLCTTLEDCQLVEKAASNHAGVIWVGMEYRYMPLVARLIDEVRGGAVGNVRMLAIREHRFPFLKKVDDWNRFSRNTGGTLVEKCCHFFDLMNHILESRPTALFASGAQDVNHLDETYGGKVPDILDNAFVIVDYENGCRAMLDLCMFAEGSRTQQEIAVTGDIGKVECLLPESTLIIGKRDLGNVEKMTISVDDEVQNAGFHHGATFFQHLAFLDAIRRGSAPDVSLSDGLLAVAMGIAAQLSIDENRRVEMKELGI